MTRCDRRAALSCLPLIGPVIGLSNVWLNTCQLAEKVQRIDPTGVLTHQTTTRRHRPKEEEQILKKFQKECSPFFKKARLYAICAIVGNALTIPATVFAPPIIGTVALASCTVMTAGHAYNFYIITRALRTMETYSQALFSLQPHTN